MSAGIAQTTDDHMATHAPHHHDLEVPAHIVEEDAHRTQQQRQRHHQLGDHQGPGIVVRREMGGEPDKVDGAEQLFAKGAGLAIGGVAFGKAPDAQADSDGAKSDRHPIAGAKYAAPQLGTEKFPAHAERCHGCAGPGKTGFSAPIPL